MQIKYLKNSDSAFLTETVQTIAVTNYAAKLILSNIEPGYTYSYQVLVNGKPVNHQKIYSLKVPALWRWRTDPPTPKFAAGSCHYTNETVYDRPGTPYGDMLPGIFNSIGISRSIIYNTFGDKEGLFYAALETYNNKYQMLTMKDVEQATSPLQTLKTALPTLLPYH